MNISKRNAILAVFAIIVALLAPNVAIASNSDRTVYVSRTGTKYHYVATCSNMSNPISMTLQEAEGRGYGPCKNCVRDTSQGGETIPGEFSDVNGSTPHSNHIKWLADNKISTGFPDGTFGPYKDVARCDMAAFLYRLAGSPDFRPSASEQAAFSDVTLSTPHAKEVWWLASKGISTGYPDGTFKPYGYVTRQDMAAFLHRMSYVIAPESPFDFVDVTENTDHYKDILWLAGMGVSEGWIRPDGTREFRGMSFVKRADMAAFLHRMANRDLITVR